MHGDWIGEILYSSQLSSTVAIFISLYNSVCYRFYVYWHNDCFHTRPNRIATTSKVGFYSGQQSATRGESSTGKIKNQHRRQGEGVIAEKEYRSIRSRRTCRFAVFI